MNVNQTIPVPLSVVILTHNEEQNIRRCVEAVAWAADVVVVDDSSTDNTTAIAEQAGARVLQHEFESFASQRNWAMDFGDIQHEWVLHLDADEVVTPALKSEIEIVLQDPADDLVAFQMCRKTMLQGRWLKYSDGFPVWIMRLVKNGNAWFVDSGHGEVAVPPTKGRIGKISEPFLHFAFSKGLANWINRHNKYSTREAELEVTETHPWRLKDIFTTNKAMRRRCLRQLSRKIPCRPVLRFFYQYVFKCGFLDGHAGWTFSWLMATYESWIVLKKQELASQTGHQPAVPARQLAEETNSNVKEISSVPLHSPATRSDRKTSPTNIVSRKASSTNNL